MNIYVSNLAFSIGDEQLKNVFTPFGEVKSAKVITDRETGNSRGFGFVEMMDEEASKSAIAGLDGTTLDSRTLNVNEAKPKSKSRNWI